MLRAGNMRIGTLSYAWVVLLGVLLFAFAEQGCTRGPTPSKRPPQKGAMGGAVPVVAFKAIRNEPNFPEWRRPLVL